MKKITLTIMMLSLVACNSSYSSGLLPSNISAHEYDEVVEYTIDFTAMFDVNLFEYYVYFYSPYCGHCTSIKDYVIHYALNTQKLRFISPDTANTVSLTTNINDNLGVTETINIRITGYPCMLKVNNKTVNDAYSGTTNIIEELFKDYETSEK